MIDIPLLTSEKSVLEHSEDVLYTSANFTSTSAFIEYFSDYTVKIKKNEYFIYKGHINKKLGIIKKGILRGFTTDENGNEISSCFYKENDIVSGNVAPNIPSSVNIKAIEDCIVAVADFENTMSLIMKDENLIKKYNETLGMVYSLINSRVTSFINLNALERYQYFLKEYPNLINRVPNYYIANFLGISPTQLSRIRREMVKK